MTKTQMPEPVAWVRRHPDGALTAEFLEDAVIDPVRKQSGAWLPMITTTQAEAYAEARVRAALEEAANVALDAPITAGMEANEGALALSIHANSRIRALIHTAK